MPRAREEKYPLNLRQDKQILCFIWEWKIASTACLAARFFMHLQNPGASTYNRLMRLKARGYVKFAFNEDEPSARVWTLAKRGFEVVKSLMGPFKDDGWLSEHIHHDLIVQAVHLGDHLWGDEPHIERYTEQQLRRCDPTERPKWIPRWHCRPDGFWKVDMGEKFPRRIVLEVELSEKGSSDYDFAGHSSKYFNENEFVLWVVRGLPFAQRILNLVRNAINKRVTQHRFFLLSDIKKFGWDAPCVLGENSGRKFRSFICSNIQNQAETATVPGRGQGTTDLILDTRVKRNILAGCKTASTQRSSLMNPPIHPGTSVFAPSPLETSVQTNIVPGDPLPKESTHES